VVNVGRVLKVVPRGGGDRRGIGAIEDQDHLLYVFVKCRGALQISSRRQWTRHDPNVGGM
jgi:hypothetical protein